MKLNPTLKLALALSVGVAGAAMAQNAATQTQPITPSTTAYSQQSSAETAINGNEQVRMAQQRLHAAGLYNGPEDGVMDPDTRAAIARYQQQNGLQRTESLDAATLASLQGGQTTGYGSTTPPAAATPKSGRRQQRRQHGKIDRPMSDASPTPAIRGGRRATIEIHLSPSPYQA